MRLKTAPLTRSKNLDQSRLGFPSSSRRPKQLSRFSIPIKSPPIPVQRETYTFCDTSMKTLSPFGVILIDRGWEAAEKRLENLEDKCGV